MISFKWRHFEKKIILMAVRWYLAYALSYRNIEELMLERGVKVDHSTINRWVIKYWTLVKRYIPKGIVRVKLNMLNQKGINRWNTYDTYTL